MSKPFEYIFIIIIIIIIIIFRKQDLTFYANILLNLMKTICMKS